MPVKFNDVIMKRIVIFASGSGSNAENIVNYFENNDVAEVVYILSNKKNAGVLERAQRLNVPSDTFTKEELNNEVVLQKLQEVKPDLIVLAGFLLKFPKNIIEKYTDKVVNIHPALLPKYGGKGMYGSHVHKAVVANKEKESGITIHYVNEFYDEGNIIFQAKTAVESEDSADDVAQKIHQLEYKHFPVVIEQMLR